MFDLVVIGAGSSGAALAYEAVRRGMRVALLEAHDPAIGTSSRSTKLLHGGVRYLELAFRRADPAQLKLVREALAERRHWIDQAPFLARELRITLPTHNAFEQLYYRLGLGMYDLLAGANGLQPTEALQPSQLRQLLPALTSEVSAGLLYSDGQFDDARLNLLLVLTARRAGVTVQRDCAVVGFEQREGRIQAAISQTADGQQQRWEAARIVNATGIAADRLRQLAQPDAPTRLLVSRGLHLVLREALCPGGVGLLIPRTRDGRVLFVLPFLGRTLVGTTDQACPAHEAMAVTQSDTTYLIEHLQQWFPGFSAEAISASWAGGRPLIQPVIQPAGGASSSRVVREHEVEQLPCGLISLLGGKWTTCRSLALDALRVIGGQHPSAQPLPLLGAAATAAQTRPALQQLREQLVAELPGGADQADHLIGSYGLRARQLVDEAPDRRDLEPLSAVIHVSRAEWRFNHRHELARSSDDLLQRRSRLGCLDQAEAERLAAPASALLEELNSASPRSHQPNP
jgi:glycerol-3-phosphate dehydrogenase